MRLPKASLLFLVLYMGEGTYVQANTEMVNFDTSSSPDVPAPIQASTWQELSAQSSLRLFSVVPAPLGTAPTDVCEPVNQTSIGACPHELWLSLATDEPPWASQSCFTLRISWPASSPADFFIDTYTPRALAKLVLAPHGQDGPPSGPSTRRTFARIRVIDTGVLVPRLRHENLAMMPVSFMVAVEPLYLGVLPASLLPTALFIVTVATVAGIVVVPRVHGYLSAIADRIRVERVGGPTRKTR